MVDTLIFVAVIAAGLWLTYLGLKGREVESLETLEREEAERVESEKRNRIDWAWKILVGRARNGYVAQNGLFGVNGIIAEIENRLGLHGELSDEVEYRLGLRDVESEPWEIRGVLGAEEEGEKEIINAYSDYMDKWRQGR